MTSCRECFGENFFCARQKLFRFKNDVNLLVNICIECVTLEEIYIFICYMKMGV